MSLSFITSSPGSPVLCSVSTLLKNLYTPMSIIWDFSSSSNIDPLLVKTFLTSMMVFVLSSISNASNSCLLLEFRNLMSSMASVGLSPNSSLIFSIASLAFCTNSCCSKKICIYGHISTIHFLISIQMFSLTSNNVLAMTVSFCSFCNCWLSLCDLCISVL